jgi:L-threonylcarbamoyladenylate synthase
MPEILKIDPSHPDMALITEAVRIMRAGGVIAYPTETFYGLGADGKNEQAVEKVFLIKGRDFKNPISLIIGNREDLSGLVGNITDAARRLMEEFWPGGLTLVFMASSAVPSRLTGSTGRIGIRISSHPIAGILAKTFSRPLTATSANLSGESECSSAAEVVQHLGNRIDAVVDGGPTAGKGGTTILDVSVHPPVVLREGIIPASLIQDTLMRYL